MLDAVANAMDAALAEWREGDGFAGVRALWLKVAMPLGSPLKIHAGDAIAEGRFCGLDVDGALLMTDTSGCVQRFTFGDVTLP